MDQLFGLQHRRNISSIPRLSLFGRLFETPSRETPPLTRGRIATYFVDVIL